MRKLMAFMVRAVAVLAVGACGAAVSAAAVLADSAQPVGSVPIPDGPAQTWIVADLDSGQVLADRDQNVPTRPRAPSRCCWRWWPWTS